MDLYGNFAAYCTKHWCKSFVSTLSCFLCHFGTHFFERTAERALNLIITGAFWDMFGSLQLSASRKSELEAIQAIVIVPIVRVVSVVFVVFPYDRPDRLVLF